MFGWHKKQKQASYDKRGKIPVIRASICTGEQVAGFKEEASGKFAEVMLIRDGGDLREFMRLYDVDEEEIKREW